MGGGHRGMTSAVPPDKHEESRDKEQEEEKGGQNFFLQ